MYAIIALGPNSVEVPCLIFQTEEAARAFMKSAKLEETEPAYWEVPNELTLPRYDGPFWDRFFTSHSFGCGEVGAFVLREVQEGKPFVGFDLD